MTAKKMICLGLLLTCRAFAADMRFVEVNPRATTALREKGSDRPFVAVGVNYFGPHIGWAPQLWRQFQGETVRQHLQMLREQGFNAIRVFLTYDSFHRERGPVNPEGQGKFKQLMSICRELGIYVMPSGPDHWEGVPEWRQGADRFADDNILQADEAWWRNFTAQWRDEPAILAWDLLNEPMVTWDSPAMKPKWNAWLRQQYGTVERIASAWGLAADKVGALGEIAVPPKEPAPNNVRLLDYQRFRESVGGEWTRRMAAAIRSADPNHLITIGYIQWVSGVYLPSVWHYAGFDLKANARHLDFMTIHFYPLAPPRPCDGPEGLAYNTAYLEALLYECSVGKPLMIGEFGWYGGGDLRVGDKVMMPAQSLADQEAWCRRLLEVSRGRVCGWLNWAFADTPTSRDLTRWSGLWTEDLQLKPWGRVFGEFARTMAAGDPDPARPFPPYLTSFPFDRRAMLTDPSTGPGYLRTLASRPAR